MRSAALVERFDKAAFKGESAQATLSNNRLISMINSVLIWQTQFRLNIAILQKKQQPNDLRLSMIFIDKTHFNKENACVNSNKVESSGSGSVSGRQAFKDRTNLVRKKRWF